MHSFSRDNQLQATVNTRCWHEGLYIVHDVIETTNGQTWKNSSLCVNPHQNDQGRKGPCYFQRLIALKCLKCQKIKKNI